MFQKRSSYVFTAVGTVFFIFACYEIFSRQSASHALQKRIYNLAVDQQTPDVQPFLRHNFRQLNRAISEYDAFVSKKISKLAERKAKPDDPELIELARVMMDPPTQPPPKLSRQPAKPTPQAAAVDAILKQTGGKFIECGAYDGEAASNTVWLERKKGWTGLLVEPDPNYYTQIIGKLRNTYSINACLSPQPYFTEMAFKDSENQGNGGQVGQLDKNGKRMMPCFPVETLLLALNWTTIDFFSLDVEGFELPVLRTIPFDKIKIRTFAIEFIHGAGGAPAYKDFMNKMGYKFEQELHHSDDIIELYVEDLVFSKL